MEFPSDKFKPKKDRYAKARGGASKFLYIACSQCEEPALVYQKDGPGKLLRCYADRIAWPPELIDTHGNVTPQTVKEAGALACTACQNIMANPMVYESENRPAYRIVPGAMHIYRSAEQARQQQELQRLQNEPNEPEA